MNGRSFSCHLDATVVWLHALAASSHASSCPCSRRAGSCTSAVYAFSGVQICLCPVSIRLMQCCFNQVHVDASSPHVGSSMSAHSDISLYCMPCAAADVTHVIYSVVSIPASSGSCCCALHATMVRTMHALLSEQAYSLVRSIVGRISNEDALRSAEQKQHRAARSLLQGLFSALPSTGVRSSVARRSVCMLADQYGMLMVCLWMTVGGCSWMVAYLPRFVCFRCLSHCITAAMLRC
jgi:hypothetical protein